MKDFTIKKAYKHDDVGQIYRATFDDGSTIDIEAKSIDDAKEKIDKHLQVIADIESKKDK